MSNSLKHIRRPVEKELKEFEGHFREAMRTPVPLLDRITYYIVRRKGKQIRPIFVFLSAKLCGGVNESTFHAATFIELLHTATLVHDDVVDDSSERRGFFSINALWKNKIAVLVGDYLLSRGVLLATKHKEYRLFEIVAESVKEMIEGELLQLEKARRLDISEEVYYDIIKQKTASLIASACSAGAVSATKDDEVVEKMRLFGEKLGIAFQIKDDLFDFGTDDIGKPTGIDIKEKKMTLPLIYALQNTTSKERRRIIRIIKRHSEDTQQVSVVIDFVLQSGGIEYAKKAMESYRNEAFEILDTFQDGPAKQSLKDLIMFVTERKK